MFENLTDNIIRMKVLYITIAFALINASACEVLTKGLSDAEEARAIHKLEKMYADLKRANQVSNEPQNSLSISNFLFNERAERKLETPNEEGEDEKEKPVAPKKRDEEETQKTEEPEKLLDPVSQETRKEDKPEEQLIEEKPDTSAPVPKDGEEKAASGKEEIAVKDGKAAVAAGQEAVKDKDQGKKKVCISFKMQGGIVVKTPVKDGEEGVYCSAARAWAAVVMLAFALFSLF